MKKGFTFRLRKSIKKNLNYHKMAQIKTKRKISKDYLYQNELVYKLINRVLKSGKKKLAYNIVYNSIIRLKEITNQDPIEILEKAIKNASPLVEVKAKRIGGAVYQIPVKVSLQRSQSLSLTWILNEARSKSNKSIIVHLSNAILDASKESGTAIKKKEELHRSAEANRAFS